MGALRRIQPRRLLSGATPWTMADLSQDLQLPDFSDFASLFQDSAGTTPVTAVEQFVGKVLDVSGNGNHLIQPSTTKRPKLSARVNLLTKTEGFVEGGKYSPANITVTTNAGAAPDGTNTGIKLAATTTATTTFFYESALGQSAYKHTWYVKKGVLSGAYGSTLLFRNTTTASNVAIASINYDTGVVTNTVGSAFSSESAGNGWWKITGTVTAGFSATDTVRLYYGWSSASATAGDHILVWHPDCRHPNIDAHLPYQWVNTATDYDADPAKFPYYLSFDGVDDALYTATTLDLTGTDKVMVCAGVTKLSDAATGTAVELSASKNANNGVFALFAPLTLGSPDISWYSKGTNERVAASASESAPVTRVITGIGDISGDISRLRVNGAVVQTETANQGTGNFGNYPLYIGARAGTSLYFNGRLYGLVIKGGATGPATVEAVERWMNTRTRAY